MTKTAPAAHAACRTTTYHAEPYRSWAMIDDALYKMTRPKETIASTVENRIQSVLSFCAMSLFRLQLVDDFFEDFAAVLVTTKLVEARARRREQDGVAGLRPGRGMSNRALDRFGIH